METILKRADHLTTLALLALVALVGCGGQPGEGPPEPEGTYTDEGVDGNANGGKIDAQNADVYHFADVYRDHWAAQGTVTRAGDQLKFAVVFTGLDSVAGDHFVAFIESWRFRPRTEKLPATCSDSVEGTNPCTVSCWQDGVCFLNMDIRKDFPPHAAKTGMTVTIDVTVPGQVAP